ncbi:MAG: cyclase family protein [Candidatus Nanopelagicales bacterium]|jgi:kynurenine formamidase
MPSDSPAEFRADVDATVSFSNGGRIVVEGFRLDLPGPTTTDDEVAALLVAALGLLMADRVEVTRLEVVAEQHKGTRGGPSAAAAGTADARRLVELSHVIEPGMTTYPGLPAPTITPHLTREASRGVYAPGTEFAIDAITMVGNTGTYLDSPFHRYEHGPDLARLPLASLVDLPTVVVRTAGSGRRAVDVGELAAFEVAGAAVLLHTGGDAGWRTPAYAQDAPFLTRAGATWLIDHGAILVGIDSVNIDDTGDPTRPAHTLLLDAGIPIVEHLTGLDRLPVHGARFTAAPPRVAAFGTFPVRAYAIVP